MYEKVAVCGAIPYQDTINLMWETTFKQPINRQFFIPSVTCWLYIVSNVLLYKEFEAYFNLVNNSYLLWLCHIFDSTFQKFHHHYQKLFLHYLVF